MAISDDIQGIVADARNFARDSYSESASLANQAINAANSVSSPTLPSLPDTVTIPELERAAPPPEEAPKMDTTGLEEPERPTLLNPHDISIPDFDAIAKPTELDRSELFNFQRPSFDHREFTEEAPAPVELDLPDAPNMDMPASPEFFEIALPEQPTFRIPGFDPERPGPRPGQPPDVVKKYRAAFDEVLPELKQALQSEFNAWIQQHAPQHHAQMELLETRLREMVEGNSTALPDETEQMLADRARARNEASRQDVEREVTEAAARMGHTAPPGALLAGLQRASQDAANANAATSAEIAVENARLTQQNIQFAVQALTTIRQMVLNTALQYTGQIIQLNSQALQYAGAIADALLETYNARVRLFQVEMEYLQVQAQVYEAELRYAFADLERYEALVRAEELKGQLNQQQVQRYQALLDSERTKLDLFTARVEGELTKVRAKQAEIEGFSAQVRAYVARMGAEEIKFRAYASAISGDEAKIRAYTADVDAYRSRISAETSKLSGEVAAAEGIDSQNRTRANIFAQDIQAYGVKANVLQTQHQSEIRAYLASLERYRAELSDNINRFRAQLDGQRARLDQETTRYQGTIQVATEQARNFMERARAVTDATSSASSVYGGLAESALGGMNTMVSMSLETEEGS